MSNANKDKRDDTWLFIAVLFLIGGCPEVAIVAFLFWLIDL